MKILSIDIGNTNVNYGLVEDDTVSELGSFPTNDLKSAPDSLEHFQNLIKQPKIEGVAFCSVVPDINNDLRALLELTKKPVFQLTHETDCGLNLNYPKPSEIGHDRIANAILAQANYPLPAIIIDLGTAITFDIITEKGYEGGIIAPGLRLMSQYLHEQTALLPELSEASLVPVEGAYGTSTIHAMQLGVSVGFSGMVEALLKHITQSLHTTDKAKEPSPLSPSAVAQQKTQGTGEADDCLKNFTILSTGGSTANLTQDWINKTQFIPHLTLKGLAIAYARFAKERCML